MLHKSCCCFLNLASSFEFSSIVALFFVFCFLSLVESKLLYYFLKSLMFVCRAWLVGFLHFFFLCAGKENNNAQGKSNDMQCVFPICDFPLYVTVCVFLKHKEKRLPVQHFSPIFPQIAWPLFVAYVDVCFNEYRNNGKQ